VTGYRKGMLNLLNLFGVNRLAHLSQFHIVLFYVLWFHVLLFHVLHFHVLQFHALQIGPSISRPSFSCPAFSAPPVCDLWIGNCSGRIAIHLVLVVILFELVLVRMTLKDLSLRRFKPDRDKTWHGCSRSIVNTHRLTETNFCVDMTSYFQDGGHDVHPPLVFGLVLGHGSLMLLYITE